MPLYEYKCATCGDIFEVRQKFADEPLKEHPGCGGTVERLISAPTLQFKGSGWYVNDYGRNGSAGVDKPKGESKDGKKAETSKPAATPAKDAPAPAKSE